MDPTFTVARTDLPVTSGVSASPLEAGDVEPSVGLSAKWGITPNVTFSGTINPDFYQIEADAAQLEVNTRFRLFFEEKRPFFLEGADFFSTPISAVFTPLDRRPLVGRENHRQGRPQCLRRLRRAR